MSYRADTAGVLMSLGYDPVLDFRVDVAGGGVITLQWLHGDPQPTEAEVDAQAGTQVYIDWVAEHGGDATKTRRKRAGDAVDGRAQSDIVLRAALLVIMDEINTLRAEHSLAARTAAQFRNAIKGKISSGDADS